MVLPAASFGFQLAVDTLAVRLTVPPAGSVENLHLQVGAPCRAHILEGLFQALAHESGCRAEEALQQHHGKKELVSPYLVRLKRGRIEPHQATLMEIRSPTWTISYHRSSAISLRATSISRQPKSGWPI
jgi:hypothetical protein